MKLTKHVDTENHIQISFVEFSENHAVDIISYSPKYQKPRNSATLGRSGSQIRQFESHKKSE